jgi:hypothetical protein
LNVRAGIAGLVTTSTERISAIDVFHGCDEPSRTVSLRNLFHVSDRWNALTSTRSSGLRSIRSTKKNGM